MRVTVRPSRAVGTAAAPPSKSMGHRALICAALAGGVSRIRGIPPSEDLLATVDCLRALGAKIEEKNGTSTVIPIETPVFDAILDVGESGSTLRFLLPVVCALGVPARFRLHGRLAQRPLEPLWSELQRCGAVLEQRGDEILVSGRLEDNRFSLAANVSSQFLSGILLALPLLGGGELDGCSQRHSLAQPQRTGDHL